MNYLEIQSAVSTLTARPDMIASGDIPLAIQAATLKMHNLDNWYKDIATSELVFPQFGWLQSLQTNALARFKNISYFRKYTPENIYATTANYGPNSGAGGPFGPGGSDYQSNTLPFGNCDWLLCKQLGFLRPVTPVSILDKYGMESTDVFYQAGSVIYAKSSTQFKFGLIGFYQFPNIDTSDDGARYKSWIAEEHPFTIIYDAVSTILQSTGQLDASRKFDSLPNGLCAQTQAALLQTNLLVQPIGGDTDGDSYEGAA